VITLCSEKVGKKNPGINYLRFPIVDSFRFQSGNLIRLSMHRREHSLGKVLSTAWPHEPIPIIAAAWMHVVGYKDIKAALVEIAKLRPIDASPVLLKSIKSFSK